VNAEVALLEHAGDWIRESDIVWAGRSTIVTTNTAVGIDHDNPILPFVSSSYRTNRVADRTFTMIAQPRQEKSLHAGISRLFRALTVRAVPG
jgi:hypothetical protein